MAKGSGGGGRSGRGGGGGSGDAGQPGEVFRAADNLRLQSVQDNLKVQYSKTMQGLRNLDNEVAKLEREGFTNRGQRNHQLYNSLLGASMNAQHKADILKSRYKNIKKRASD